MRAPPSAARRGRPPAGSSPARRRRAATARARSATTSPSAPSATPESVSGRPATSDPAGDFAIIALRRRGRESRAACGTTRCRNRAERRSSPVTQASRSRSGTSSSRSNSPTSASVNSATAASAKRPMIRSVSRIPRCQERNSTLRRRSPGPRSIVYCRSSSLQRQKPGRAGRGYIAGRMRPVRRGMLITCHLRCMNWRCGRPCSIRCSPC